MQRALLTAAAILTLGAGLAACETATPYQPLNPANADAGGYRDAKLDDSHFRVSFQGNSLTSRETVERYLLYRAAELTVGQGADWFITADQQTHKDTEAFIDPMWGPGWRPSWRFRGRGGWGGWGYWGYGPGPWGPAYVSEFNRYEVSAEIMIGRGPKPANALDARQVMQNLGPGIQRPQA